MTARASYRPSAATVQRIYEIAEQAAEDSKCLAILTAMAKRYSQFGIAAVSRREPLEEHPAWKRVHAKMLRVCDAEIHAFAHADKAHKLSERGKNAVAGQLWDLFWRKWEGGVQVQRHRTTRQQDSRNLVSDELLAKLAPADSAPILHVDRPPAPPPLHRAPTPQHPPTICRAHNFWEAVILLEIPDHSFPLTGEGCFGTIGHAGVAVGQ